MLNLEITLQDGSSDLKWTCRPAVFSARIPLETFCAVLSFCRGCEYQCQAGRKKTLYLKAVVPDGRTGQPNYERSQLCA